MRGSRREPGSRIRRQSAAGHSMVPG
jgi:hypothetical protein